MTTRSWAGCPDASGRLEPMRLRGPGLGDGSGRRWRPTVDVAAAWRGPAHWLANCHSFLVDDLAGRPVGVVDDVVTHQLAGAAIVVAGQRRGRLIVPVTDVVELEPGERRLTVVRGRSWIVERQPRRALLRWLADLLSSRGRRVGTPSRA